MSDDRRHEDRGAIGLRVRLHYSNLQAFVQGYSENITRGGIFLLGAPPKAIDTLVRFELILDDATIALRGEGRVVWSREQGQRPGIGLKFIRLDPRSRSLIDELVRSGQLGPQSIAPARKSEPTRSQPSSRPPAELLAMASALAPLALPRDLVAPRSLESLPPPAPRPIDLEALTRELDALEAALARPLLLSPRASTDLDTLTRELDAIASLTAFALRPSSRAPEPRAQAPQSAAPGPIAPSPTEIVVGVQSPEGGDQTKPEIHLPEDDSQPEVPTQPAVLSPPSEVLPEVLPEALSEVLPEVLPEALQSAESESLDLDLSDLVSVAPTASTLAPMHSSRRSAHRSTGTSEAATSSARIIAPMPLADILDEPEEPEAPIELDDLDIEDPRAETGILAQTTALEIPLEAPLETPLGELARPSFKMPPFPRATAATPHGTRPPPLPSMAKGASLPPVAPTEAEPTSTPGKTLGH